MNAIDSSQLLVHMVYKDVEDENEKIKKFFNEIFKEQLLKYSDKSFWKAEICKLENEKLKKFYGADYNKKIAEINKTINRFRQLISQNKYISNEVICFAEPTSFFCKNFIQAYGELGIVFYRNYLEYERARPVHYFQYSPHENILLKAIEELAIKYPRLAKTKEFGNLLTRYFRIMKPCYESDKKFKNGVSRYEEHEWRIDSWYRYKPGAGKRKWQDVCNKNKQRCFKFKPTFSRSGQNNKCSIFCIISPKRSIQELRNYFKKKRIRFGLKKNLGVITLKKFIKILVRKNTNHNKISIKVTKSQKC